MKTPLHVGPVMIPYLLVFIGSLAVDCIPVFAPPAWMLMLFLMMKFQLQAPLVAVVGALGSVAGRMIYMTYNSSVDQRQNDSQRQKRRS
jgi:hypothetical protein